MNPQQAVAHCLTIIIQIIKAGIVQGIYKINYEKKYHLFSSLFYNLKSAKKIVSKIKIHLFVQLAILFTVGISNAVA